MEGPSVGGHRNPPRPPACASLGMTPRLTNEQRDALHRRTGPVRVEDDQTQKVFFIVDEDLHERAMQALEEQETLRGIQAGIRDMEAGRVVPFAEVDARLRKQLRLPVRRA